MLRHNSFKDLAIEFLEALSSGNPNKKKLLAEISSFNQPYDRNEIYLLAKQAHDYGHLAESVSIYQLCVAKHPEWAECWFGLGSILLVCKNYKDSRDAFELALHLDPNIKEKPKYDPNPFGISTMGCLVDDRDQRSPRPVLEFVRKDTTKTLINDIPKFQAALIVLVSCPPEDYEECWNLLMWEERLINLCDSRDILLLETKLGDCMHEFFDNLFCIGYVRVFGTLAPKSEFHKIKSSNVDKGYPFIPLNIMMRSGNHYLSDTLSRIYDANPIVWTLPTGPMRSLLADLSSGGVVGRNMEPATPEIIETYLSNGIDEVVVQIRDPRQAAYSLGLFKEKNFLIEYGKDFSFLDQNEKIDFWIEHELPGLVYFIESWIDVEKTGKMKVHFSRFDDFIKDPCDVINFLFSLYKAPFRLLEPLITPEESSTFRSGELNEWKQVFSENQSKRATNMVPKSILDKFDWN